MSYIATKILAGELDVGLQSAINTMESNGLHFCYTTYKEIRNRVEEDMEKLLLDFYYEYGLDYKSSPKLFSGIFKASDFNKLVGSDDGIKISYTKKQFEELKDERIRDMMIALKECDYFISHYTDTFLKHIKDGVLYPRFYEQKSLRLGTSNPNLSNLPATGKYDIRKCIIPHRPGYVFMNIDYVAQELRLQADMSGDESLIKIINDGLDIHSFVQELGNIPTRRMAKNFNFASSYGAGLEKLSRILNTSVEQVRSLKKQLDIKMPGASKFRKKLQSFAKRHGCIVNGKGAVIPCARYHDALNYTIQSTAASIMREVLSRINEELQYCFKLNDAKLVMQVYDSVIISLPANNVDEVKELVSDIMIDSYKPHNGLPMEVDTTIYNTNLSEKDGD